MAYHHRSLEEDATLIVRRHAEPRTIPRRRKSPRSFGPARSPPRVTPWVIAVVIVLGAALRPIHPMKSWRRAANELQLSERARALLLELR